MGGAVSLTTLTHLGAAAVAALGIWYFQEARLGADLAAEMLRSSEYRLQVEGARTAANARVAKASQDIADKYQGALNEARQRETLLRTELDHLKSVSDGLRDQAATAARRLADAPPDAVLEYATTVNAVYDDCRRAYGDMAGKAAGHAADVRTLTEAWPIIPSRPPSPGHPN